MRLADGVASAGHGRLGMPTELKFGAYAANGTEYVSRWPDDSVRRMSCLCHGNTERDKVPMSWIPKLPGFIAAIAHLQQIVA